MDEYSMSLASYRIEKAYDCLKAAKLLLENERYPDSLNRSYYAIFHAARAIMALDGEDRKKHSGVIAYFREQYVKKGVFDRAMSDIIQDAFNIRQESDYLDFFVVSRQEVIEQADAAEVFCAAVMDYINKVYLDDPQNKSV